MSAKVSMYNNNPLLILQNDKFPLALGVSKAKLVLEHLEELRNFVTLNDSKKEITNAKS